MQNKIFGGKNFGGKNFGGRNFFGGNFFTKSAKIVKNYEKSKKKIFWRENFFCQEFVCFDLIQDVIANKTVFRIKIRSSVDF